MARFSNSPAFTSEEARAAKPAYLYGESNYSRRPQQRLEQA